MSKTNQIVKANKKQIIMQNALKPNDVGSAAVQLALVKYKLQTLQKHQEQHKKDVSIKRTIAILKSRKKAFEAAVA